MLLSLSVCEFAISSKTVQWFVPETLYGFARQMSKHWSLTIYMIRANLSFSFRLHFCVFLLLYASLGLLHLKVLYYICIMFSCLHILQL